MHCKSYNNPIIIKTSSSNDAVISGYASIFNIIDQHNDIVVKGAFANSCNPTKIKLLWQHDCLKPLGIVKSLLEDDYGLKIEAVINSKINYGIETIELLKQGVINGLSIGFYIKSAKYNTLGQKVITDIDLKEISIVTFPANEHAQISNIEDTTKQRQYGDQMNSEINVYNEKINMLEQKINNMMDLYLRPDIGIFEDNQGHKAFNAFLRQGIENNLLTKSSFSSTEETGGALVIPSLYDKIISEITARSPMRQLASIETISTSALDLVIEEDKFVNGWVGETDEREDTDTPKLKHHRISVHELYAQPKATQRLIDDSVVQIEQWIVQQLSDSFVRSENEAFINGDGNKKPIGLLYSILTNHQESVFRPTAREISADTLLQLISALDEEYLANATFLMNRATLAMIQGLKDNTGRFIWQPSLSDSLKQSIFGIPVVCCSNIPGPKEGHLPPIILGDIKSAYKIVDRNGINIMRDPYTNKPFVKFYTVKRVGADVVNNKACRVVVFE